MGQARAVELSHAVTVAVKFSDSRSDILPRPPMAKILFAVHGRIVTDSESSRETVRERERKR